MLFNLRLTLEILIVVVVDLLGIFLTIGQICPTNLFVFKIYKCYGCHGIFVCIVNVFKSYWEST